jgi:hypothetical protein
MKQSQAKSEQGFRLSPPVGSSKIKQSQNKVLKIDHASPITPDKDKDKEYDSQDKDKRRHTTDHDNQVKSRTRNTLDHHTIPYNNNTIQQ